MIHFFYEFRKTINKTNSIFCAKKNVRCCGSNGLPGIAHNVWRNQALMSPLKQRWLWTGLMQTKRKTLYDQKGKHCMTKKGKHCWQKIQKENAIGLDYFWFTHTLAKLFILTSGQTGIVRPVCPYFLLFE